MQYDVYRNPVPRARGAYPFVIVLQSDLAETGRDRAVAMVAKRSDMGEVAGKLTPIAALEGEDHVLIIPSLTSLRATDIDRPIANLAAHHDRIVAALDWLFTGV